MCYAFPTIGAIVTSVVLRKTKNVKIFWLNLLFWGGTIFGIIDHVWNKELFLISKNILGDLMLGITITAVILVSWAIMVVVSKTSPSFADYIKAPAK